MRSANSRSMLRANVFRSVVDDPSSQQRRGDRIRRLVGGQRHVEPEADHDRLTSARTPRRGSRPACRRSPARRSAISNPPRPPDRRQRVRHRDPGGQRQPAPARPRHRGAGHPDRQGHLRPRRRRPLPAVTPAAGVLVFGQQYRPSMSAPPSARASQIGVGGTGFGDDVELRHGRPGPTSPSRRAAASSGALGASHWCFTAQRLRSSTSTSSNSNLGRKGISSFARRACPPSTAPASAIRLPPLRFAAYIASSARAWITSNSPRCRRSAPAATPTLAVAFGVLRRLDRGSHVFRDRRRGLQASTGRGRRTPHRRCGRRMPRDQPRRESVRQSE